MNELLNQAIDQHFLPDTRRRGGRLNGLVSRRTRPASAEVFGPLLGYCFQHGVWVFRISMEAAAKPFQPEKDPVEQAQAFSFPRGGLLQPRTFTHLQSCLGNNRPQLTVYVPGKLRFTF